MGKTPRRKPPRKKRTLVDEDPALVELAAAIADNQLAKSSEGWFELPWRNGWNAAMLCYRVARRYVVREHPAINQADLWLGDVVRDRVISQRLYDEAGDHLVAMAAVRLFGQEPNAEILSAALRCVQLVISNSHGGGHGFNEPLKRHVTCVADSGISDLVLQERCVDAIGVSMVMDNTADDRLRRAFRTAWERGLYHAAYALPIADGALTYGWGTRAPNINT